MSRLFLFMGYDLGLLLPVTITNIHQAFREIKHFAYDQWEGNYRRAARQALTEILETRMHNTIDAYLNQVRDWGLADCRNGSYSRYLVTDLGNLELQGRSMLYQPMENPLP